MFSTGSDALVKISYANESKVTLKVSRKTLKRIVDDKPYGERCNPLHQSEKIFHPSVPTFHKRFSVAHGEIMMASSRKI